MVNDHDNIFQNLPDRATQSSIFESSRIQTAQNSHGTWSRLIFRHTNRLQALPELHRGLLVNKGAGGTANEMRRESGRQVEGQVLPSLDCTI